jgi:hypothetical protein
MIKLLIGLLALLAICFAVGRLAKAAARACRPSAAKPERTARAATEVSGSP